MAVRERLKTLREVERPWWLAVVACSGAVVLGHFLRQLEIELNPLAWVRCEQLPSSKRKVAKKDR